MPRQFKRKKILIIKNRAIGDTVLLTGTLKTLKELFPTYELHVLVKAPAGVLLEGLPFVDRVISIFEPPKKLDRIAYWLRMIMRLRDSKYEFVFNFHASFKTALISKVLRAKKVACNNHDLKKRNWFSDFKVPNRGIVKSNIDRDLDLVRSLSIGIEATDCMPVLHVSENEKKQALLLLESKGIRIVSGAPEKPLLFFGIGASKPTKCWPIESYAELAHLCVKNLNCQVLITSLKSELENADHFFREAQKYPDLKNNCFHFHEIHLKQVANLIFFSKLYVGNDTGLKHVAVALGLPTLTFFGPENPTEWHPYDEKRHPILYIKDLKCRTETGLHWCPLEKCDKHGHQCMKNIPVSKAFENTQRLLT